MTNTYDLVIIGGGPAGYTGAIRAAQLGMKTALIESRATLGGTCLNVGCIPSKSLLESSEYFSMAKHDFENHGILTKEISLNLSAMMSRKNKIVGDLQKGIAFLMKKNKIDVFHGLGKLKSATEVDVKIHGNSSQILSAKKILLATGSKPSELPNIHFDGKTVVSSTEALEFSEVPNHLVVVGGGVIGLELGSVWCRLGAKVTVLEYLDRIGGPLDLEVSRELLKILKKQGMNFELKSQVTGVQVNQTTAKVTYKSLETNETKTEEASKVILSVGRQPFSDGLGLEAMGVAKNPKGFVIINEKFQTSVPSIFAVGDLVPGPMLAHKAEEEAVAVIELMAGKAGHVSYRTLPSVIYTYPEVACVGETEETLKDKNIEYSVGKFPFMANARAKAIGCTEGFVKILAHKTTDEILGAHILGPRASELLEEIVVAMEFYGTSEDLARSFHAHPTLNEVVRESALGVLKLTRQL